MEITEAQYARIAPYLPVQRGNVSLSNLPPSCTWRSMAANGAACRHFGNWHTIYMRMNRWSKNGVLDRVFEQLREQPHQAAPGPSRRDWGAQDRSRSADPAWTTKLPADARTAITFSLSPGQAHDAPEGRKLLQRLGAQPHQPCLIMDRAYEGNETRQLALDLGFTPVVPPLKTRRDPWVYNREMYRRRNEIERLFDASRASAESSLASRSSTWHPFRAHMRCTALV